MQKKLISLGFSPCPNDTFIFDALVNNRIDTGNYKFESLLDDVEKLNNYAHKGMLDVTKVSVGAFPLLAGEYCILDSGSALGTGVGPLLVEKKHQKTKEYKNMLVAIPGKYTTANLLLSIFFPEIVNKKEIVFSEIEETVLSGKTDAGLLIHEGRFTYEEKGLVKIHDLGEVWERNMHTPLPLGCICIKRSFSDTDRKAINELIKSSINFAFQNSNAGREYIKKNAQELSDDVIQQHIQLYVNDFSVDLGTSGRSAIENLLKKGHECGLLPAVNKPFFN